MALSLSDGVKPFLDATAAQHNGRGFAKFEQDLQRLNNSDPEEPFRITVSGLAKVWGVHRHTFQSYIDQYNKERDTDNDR